MQTRLAILWFLVAGVLLSTAPRPHARQAPAPTIDSVVNSLSFRNIGPFRTAAWVTSVAVPESPARDHLYTMYAATRSGGLWKTTNAGTTWAVMTDPAGIESVGAVALAPS